jgi:hypothetical protein
MGTYTEDDFIKENEYKITEDGVTLTPPIYYQSLNDAFNNYFKTVKNNKNTYHFLLDFNTIKTNSFDFHNLDSAVFTILGFHRFFELLLKDILRRIDPFLAVKFPEKEKETIKFLNKDLDHEKMETIEFKKAFERFKEALNYSNDNPDNIQYSIVKKFFFLKSDNTLDRLAKWRNRIMHNGNTLPNIYLMDYLISQKVIPLVDAVVKADKDILKDYLPHYFETLTGIKVINEIIKIKIDYKDYQNESEKNELIKKVLRLAHLKELGRAAYTLDVTIKNNISYDNPYYNNPIGRNIRCAEQEQLHESFHTIKNCPCCGKETLVVYRKEYYNLQNHKTDFISWFNCFTCTYSLQNNIGDPEYFGYSKDKLFATE